MFTKKCIVFIAITLLTIPAISQQTIQGNIVDSATNLPLEGATITLLPSKISTITNASGNFIFKKSITDKSLVSVSEIGYAEKIFSIDDITKNSSLKLSQKKILLQDVIVTANNENIFKPISRTDIAMRGV